MHEGKNKIICDVCRKVIQEEGQIGFVMGLYMSFDINGADKDALSYLKKQLGPYKPRPYHICYECALRAYGV